MDEFLALALKKMNKFNSVNIEQLSTDFRLGLRETTLLTVTYFGGC